MAQASRALSQILPASCTTSIGASAGSYSLNVPLKTEKTKTKKVGKKKKKKEKPQTLALITAACLLLITADGPGWFLPLQTRPSIIVGLDF